MVFVFLFAINLVIISPSFSQYSINYMSRTAGAIVGDGVTSNVSYFGPNGYGDLGACGTNDWRWTHALCSAVNNENDLATSTKTNSNSGSTWLSGSGASRYMVIDLGQSRNFNELRVFQMHASDGKVTSIRMYSHPSTTTLPTYSDPNWGALFTETNISAGTYSNGTVSDPTIITFPYTTSRFVLIEAKNNGTYGDPNYTEIRELRLFNNNVPLPIELLSFSAINIKNEQIKLNWQTASELNNDYFTIEHSKNGFDWEEVIRIDGAGNSSSLLSYSTIDNNPFDGVSYYRLKQTDFDGQFEYSQIISVTIQQLVNSQMEIYPNPATNQIIIKGSSSELEEITFFNALGQDVTSLISQIATNKNKLIIDVSNLNTGMYFVKTKTTANKMYKQ